MAYHSSYRGLNQKNGSRSRPHIMSWLVVALFVLLFGAAVYWFRTSKKTPSAARADSIANVLAPVSIDASVVNGAVNLESPSASLIGVASKKTIGTATRGEQSNVFHVAMSATLPDIDREKQFYAAWLVRQIPYDYVSVGSFTTNDLGVFVLDWNGDAGKPPGNYQAYTHVVITLQTKDGDPDPQNHIVEGDFGK